MASSCSKRYKSNDYLDTVDSSKEESFAAQVLCIEKALGKELCKLDFPEKVTHVYNPLEYADEPHSNFVQRFVTGTKYILFLGMNPGPFGMAQNGVGCAFLLFSRYLLVRLCSLHSGTFR